MWVWVKADGTPSDMYQGGWKGHIYDWVEHEVSIYRVYSYQFRGGVFL